jgi:Phosphatidylglycerol lysyltransferase, C-terminal
MEYLIASSCLAFQAEGARFVALSGAPLARAPGAVPAAPLERLLESFGAAMEPYYGFRSLHSFKTKFKDVAVAAVFERDTYLRVGRSVGCSPRVSQSAGRIPRTSSS